MSRLIRYDLGSRVYDLVHDDIEFLLVISCEVLPLLDGVLLVCFEQILGVLASWDVQTVVNFRFIFDALVVFPLAGLLQNWCFSDLRTELQVIFEHL